mgnify:CR=1 FL=1
MSNISNERIVKLGKQKRISLNCTNCSYFGLMNIKRILKFKTRLISMFIVLNVNIISS